MTETVVSVVESGSEGGTALPPPPATGECCICHATVPASTLHAAPNGDTWCERSGPCYDRAWDWHTAQREAEPVSA